MARGFDRPLYIQPFDHRVLPDQAVRAGSALERRANRRHLAVQAGDHEGFQLALAGGVPHPGWTSNCCDPCVMRPARRLHPGAEERTRRVRLRIRRGLRAPYRDDRPDLLQGSGTLQPGGLRQQAGRSAVRCPSSSQRKRSLFMFEPAGAGGERAARHKLKGQNRWTILSSGPA